MNISNPSVEDVRAWAYSDKDWLCDEWDLFLSWTLEIELFIELATDHHCPKKSFFLHMLYYMVGFAYSSSRRTDQYDRIQGYIEKSEGVKHGDIKLWRSRTNSLLNGREVYDYDNWRGGVYAGYEFT